MSAASRNDNRPIGVFDSGLGGLTVLKELQAMLPGERLIYLGDTARTPYGSKGAQTIVRYSDECAKFLLRHEVKLLVVACNTASSIALSYLKESCPCPVIGTIEQAVRSALRNARRNRIGIIGTEATIASGAYQKRLQELAPQVTVLSQACPLFVPLVEQGMFSGEIVDKVIEHYLAGMRSEGVDALVLGCTHYPLLSAALGKYFGDEVAIVECAKAIAEEVGEILSAQGLRASTSQQSSRGPFFVTDEVSRFDRLAALLLGESMSNAKKVELVSAER